MSLRVEFELTYSDFPLADDPDPQVFAQEVARLLRQPVKHISGVARDEESSVSEPTVEVRDTTVVVTLEVSESPKGSLPRVQWIVNEFVARLMRDTRNDRPDLATNPTSITARLAPNEHQ